MQHDCILVEDAKNKQLTKYIKKIIQIVKNVKKKRLPLIGIFNVWTLSRQGNPC